VKIWLTLLGLRLSPLVPAPLVNFFAAIFDVSPLQYLTTRCVGQRATRPVLCTTRQQGHHFCPAKLRIGGNLGYCIDITYKLALCSAMVLGRSVLNELKLLKGLSTDPSVHFRQCEFRRQEVVPLLSYVVHKKQDEWRAAQTHWSSNTRGGHVERLQQRNSRVARHERREAQSEQRQPKSSRRIVHLIAALER